MIGCKWWSVSDVVVVASDLKVYGWFGMGSEVVYICLCFSILFSSSKASHLVSFQKKH